jgi:hypothetical protein
MQPYRRTFFIYFVQTFGNIYTIVPFCKHALRVFHAIAWLILLAHAQINFPTVIQVYKLKIGFTKYTNNLWYYCIKQTQHLQYQNLYEGSQLSC